MKPEEKVKAQVKEKLNMLGAYYAMPIGTKFGTSGVPDFLVSHKGKFIGLETKGGNNKWPSRLQVDQLRQIEASGGKAMVVNESNIDDLENEIESGETQEYWRQTLEREHKRKMEMRKQDEQSGIRIRRGK